MSEVMKEAWLPGSKKTRTEIGAPWLFGEQTKTSDNINKAAGLAGALMKEVSCYKLGLEKGISSSFPTTAKEECCCLGRPIGCEFPPVPNLPIFLQMMTW
jgi:hypothetical protein